MEVVLESVTGEDLASARLVRAAIDGDRGAFATLVEPHLATALGAAVVLNRSHADGADTVQDALLSAWKGLDRLRDPVAFPAWFRAHVIRAALRHAGRRSRVRELDLDDAVEMAAGGSVERLAQHRQLARAFDRLEPPDRALLTMGHLWDAPVAEVAQAFGIPAGTVKSRTSAAMEWLRAAYDGASPRLPAPPAGGLRVDGPRGRP
ncbi:MAG: RNA polymerase sigma factor [Candidatus Limnocylindrales bacterium]